MTSISSGTPTSTSSPSWTDVLSRIADTRRKDTIAPAKRAVTSITLPTWSRSLVPMAMTSPVLTLRGSEPPRRTVWRVTSWTTRYDAVSQLVTAKRCRMIPVKACRRPMASMTPGPEHQLLLVAGGDALVDRAAEHGGQHGLAGHPDDAEGHAAEQGVPLALREPPQEPPR